MIRDGFELEAFVAAPPERVYAAWLDAREHATLTGGGETTIEPWVGGRYTAFDGYVHGILLGLESNRRIVQTWRTADFAPEMRDARVAIEFEPARGGTRVRIRQSDTPPDRVTRFEAGWKEHYLDRLARHFARPKGKPDDKPPTVRERASTWGRNVRRGEPAKTARKLSRKKPAARRPKRPAPKPARKKKSRSRR